MNQELAEVFQFALSSGLSTFAALVVIACLFISWWQQNRNYRQLLNKYQASRSTAQQTQARQSSTERALLYLRTSTARDEDPEVLEFVLSVLNDGNRDGQEDYDAELLYRTNQARMHADELGELIQKRIDAHIAGAMV
jgi:hypothetical protein